MFVSDVFQSVISSSLFCSSPFIKMRKVLNFVKGKREDKKDPSLSLNVTNISVEITDPAGVTTPSDDYDFVGTTQQCTDYEVSCLESLCYFCYSLISFFT